MPPDTTLLNLDHAPAILEMRAFFKNTTGRQREYRSQKAAFGRSQDD